MSDATPGRLAGAVSRGALRRASLRTPRFARLAPLPAAFSLLAGLSPLLSHAADEAPAPAAAASAPQVVTVQAHKPDNGSYTAKSAATATGLSLSLRDTPQSVTVITRERLDDQAMATVGDALRNTIGVSLKPVDRGRNNLSARGFDINNFQLDGVPFATGNIGLETTSTALYERIEVVRGATGLLSGAGDPSAAVNMVRKHADSRSFAGSAKLELGSWNQRTGTIDLSVPLNAAGTVRARAVASATRQDAFIDLENKRQTVVYGVVDADLTPTTRLSLGASDQRDKRNGVMWAGLPYWYADGTRTDWDRSKTTAVRWNQWDTTDQSAFGALSQTLGNQWTLRLDVSHRKQVEDSKLLWSWGDPDRTTGLGLEGLPYHYLTTPRQLHASVSASGPFTLFGREHEAAVGVMRSKLDSGWSNRDAVGELPLLPDFNHWDGSYPEPALGPRYDFSGVGTTRQSAAYAVARLQLTDALKLIAGARTSTWQRDETGSARLKQSCVVTPYAGLVYDITPQLSAYGSYTEIFNPQTSRDRFGAYLDPLVGQACEAGLKADLMGGKLSATAAVFRTEQENFAVADVGYFVPGTNTPAMRAARGVKAQGYELELNGELASNWDFSAGWTQFTARDAARVDVAVDHPRKQFKVFTKVALPGALQGLSVGGGVNWEGDRPARATNPATGVEERVGQPAYALVDLMARYDINPRLGVQLNITNATDRKYRSGSFWWGAPYTYGEPRKLLLALDARF